MIERDGALSPAGKVAQLATLQGNYGARLAELQADATRDIEEKASDLASDLAKVDAGEIAEVRGQ